MACVKVYLCSNPEGMYYVFISSFLYLYSFNVAICSPTDESNGCNFNEK